MTVVEFALLANTNDDQKCLKAPISFGVIVMGIVRLRH